MKNKVINVVLWIAFLLAMAASIQHLASTFGTAEQAGAQWLGWIPAVAVDAGLAALAYTIQQRKRAKRPTKILWGGVVGFAIISALANLYHALAVEAVANLAIRAVLDSWGTLIAKAILLSATLPAMYIFLGEIVSGDDSLTADKLAKQAEREQTRLDKQAETERLVAEREAAEAKRLAAETERLLLEAKQIEGAREQVPAESEILAFLCEDCGRSFRSVNARNAHKCESKATSNGKARVGEG